MSNHSLREVCKFLSGMVAGKILFVFWLSSYGLIPLVLAGTPFSAIDIFPATIFNIAILAILIYYGWHVKSPMHSPSERNLLVIVGFILLVVAIIHAMRLLFGIDFILGDIVVPVWLSWVGFALAAYLSYASFHFAMVMKRKK